MKTLVLDFCAWGLWVRLTKDTLTGEKAYKFCLMMLFSQSDSLQSHELHHARLLCPLLSPGVCSVSCPFSWWCHLTISSSVAPFSFCPQSFPASGSFPVSGLFTSSGQIEIGQAEFSNANFQCQMPSWNFSFSISLSNEYSGLISFRINWFALLAVPGILKPSPKL